MRKLFSWVTLVAVCTSATASFGADGPEARSVQLSQSYLREWSTDRRAALARVDEGYAPRVMFYGRVLTRGQLYREKYRALQRWPVRHYVLRPETVQVACKAATASCLVRGIMDWRVGRRDRLAQGSSTFLQGYDLSARPQIVSENGRVLKRRTPSPRVASSRY